MLDMWAINVLNEARVTDFIPSFIGGHKPLAYNKSEYRNKDGSQTDVYAVVYKDAGSYYIAIAERFKTPLGYMSIRVLDKAHIGKYPSKARAVMNRYAHRDLKATFKRSWMNPETDEPIKLSEVLI